MMSEGIGGRASRRSNDAEWPPIVSFDGRDALDRGRSGVTKGDRQR
jgi:hypothetical protein